MFDDSTQKPIARVFGGVAAAFALAGLVLAPVHRAEADEPVTVAVITGGSAIVAAWGAAAIAGAATVTAAVILTSGGESGEGSEEGETTVPGTDENGDIEESRSRSVPPSGPDVEITNDALSVSGSLAAGGASAFVSQSGTDPVFSSFVNRSMYGAVAIDDTYGLGATLQYNLHGDVLDSPPSNQRFLNSDKTVWTFDLQGPGFLPFGFEDLTLETHDVPGSIGYSALVMTAHQNGELIMEWHASVVQGNMPVYGELPDGGETVTATADRIHIEDLLFKIPVEYDANNTAEVKVTVYFEDSGART